MEELTVDLKVEFVTNSLIKRGDLIFFEESVFICVSHEMNLFINMDNRQKQEINAPFLHKMNKLELIPKKWTTSENKVMLEGQELGLGPMHTLEIIGMKTFEELEIIKSAAEKNQKISYKVILGETKLPKTYLIVSIELMA